MQKLAIKLAMQHIYIYVLARKNVTKTRLCSYLKAEDRSPPRADSLAPQTADDWRYQSSAQTSILRYNNMLAKEQYFMTATNSELYRSIHAQPQAIRTLLADWDRPTQAAEHLKKTGRILLAGIGTSFHAATVGEYLLRLAGADAWAVRSFEFVHYPRPLRSDDGVIIISHRGSKIHGNLAVQRALEAGVTTVGITGKQSKMQGPNIIIETVEQETSSAHSISYTSTLTRLGQIAARLASMNGLTEQAQRIEEGLIRIPALIEDMLAREEAVQQIAQEAAAQQRRLYF